MRPPLATEMGQYGLFRALRYKFFDERARIEARSVYSRAQMIRVVAWAQTDRQIWRQEPTINRFGRAGPPRNAR